MSALEERTTCSLVEGCLNPETTGGGCIRHKFADGVRVNGIALFRHDREVGVTQAQKAAEMFSGVRENQGRKTKGTKDIQRVRGRRGPTHVMRDGEWVKS